MWSPYYRVMAERHTRVSCRVEELVTRVWHTGMGQGLLQSRRVLTRVWLTRVVEQLGFLQSRGW